jgi:salicylate hydroxylase
VTQREDEAKETWRAMDQKKQEEFKNSPLANWGFEGEGLVKGAEKLVKVRKEIPIHCHIRL